MLSARVGSNKDFFRKSLIGFYHDSSSLSTSSSQFGKVMTSGSLDGVVIILLV